MTQLRPKIRNVTRWLSTFEMIERYELLRPFFASLIEDYEEIEDFILNLQEERLLSSFMPKLRALKQVTERLQHPNTTFEVARALFDHTIATYPTMNKYISPTSSIVHDPTFESAIHKISAGQEKSLVVEEIEAVKKLLLNEESNDTQEAPDFLAAALKDLSKKNIYHNVDLIIPIGSVVVESLFSVAKHVLGDRRMSLLPVHVEEQLFLKINRDLWIHTLG